MRKFLLTLCALWMATTSLWAFEVDGINYAILSSTDKTVVVTGGGEYSGEINIPKRVTDNDITYTVTSIGEHAFSDCSGLTSVIIPNSVTSIGNYAFLGCTGLTSVIIPNSVITMGYYVFQGCKNLTSATIGDSVTSIREHTFSNCPGLTSVTIGDSVTSIGNNAFAGCTNLTSVTIPNSVTSIGEYAFYGCTGLTSVTIGDSVTSIGYRAFYGCTNLTSVTMGHSVTSIGRESFRNCSLISVTLPNSVTEIGSCAFLSCSLTEITIPEGVSRIGERAFSCAPLTTVNYNAINCQNSSPFNNCSSLSVLHIGENVTQILGNAFYGCSAIAQVAIPESVTFIGSNAFANCTRLKKVEISNLEKFCQIEFGDSFSNPLYYAHDLYLNKSLVTDLVIPSGITAIKNYAFNGCSISSVAIPNEATSIGTSAFQGCTKLTSAVIPDEVGSLGVSAFEGCTALKEAKIGNKVEKIDNRTFYNCSQLTQVEIGESVASIGDYAFNGCSALPEIRIPGHVNTIGDLAFCDCKLLNLAILEEGITEIKSTAFANCSILPTITIPGSVMTIGKSAFSGCGKLTNVVFANGEGDMSIGSSVLGSSVKTLYIGRNIIGIPFKGLSITELTIDGGATTIGSSAYSGCTKLKKLTVGNSVTQIGNSAFNGCTQLAEVSLGTGLTSIGELAFYNCGALNTLYSQATTPPTIAETTFIDAHYTNATLLVPTENEADYQAAEYWSNFSLLKGSEGRCFLILNADVAHGSVTEGGTYETGTTVTIEATPNGEYRFVQWSYGNTENPRELVLTQDTTLTAEFELITYQLDVQPDDATLGCVVGNNGEYKKDESVTLVAAPNVGITFVQWSDGNTDNPRTVTMTEDLTLTAQFAQPDYQVTALVNDVHLGVVSKAVLLEAIPSSNKAYFRNWSDGSTENPRTIYPTEDITLTANFVEGSDIESLDESGVQVYANDGVLHIDNAEAGVEVAICDLSGRIVKSCETEAGSTRIALDNGVYVVRVADNTVKVVV